MEDEVKRQVQSERDRSEIKIMPLVNGWILKTPEGWYTYDGLEALIAATREAVVKQGCPKGSRLK
jgi:hypothetical protein